MKIFETFASWRVFDADRICHEIYAEKNSAVAELIAARWGRDLIGADGTPDRVKIAQKVFGCENERAWLNSLMHPEIMRRIELGIDRCDCASFVMIDAPLLFESGWDKSVELVIAVWSSPEIQMERLLARGWTVDHAQARIASQMPAHKKLELADYGIINNASLAVLEEQCVELRNKLN